MGRQKILNDCCCAVTAMLRQEDLKLSVAASAPRNKSARASNPGSFEQVIRALEHGCRWCVFQT
jgi:hypothetical protein